MGEFSVGEDEAPGGFNEEEGSTGRIDYRDLDVWRESMTLSVEIYACTRAFPMDEKYGLVSQMRRASVSIPSNIAEGYGRETSGAYVQFLRIAQGSAKELETLLELSKRLGLLDTRSSALIDSLLLRVSKMLRALIRAIEKRSS